MKYGEGLKSKNNNISLIKLNLKSGVNAICYTNIIYYDNKNKTLPLGMDISQKILVDVSKLNLELKDKKIFRMAIYEDEQDEMSDINIKTIEVSEYNIIT